MFETKIGERNNTWSIKDDSCACGLTWMWTCSICWSWKR